MQTFRTRALAQAAVLVLALTGCATGNASREMVLPSMAIQVHWPASDSSLTTLSATVPEVSRPRAKPRPTASTAKVITALTVLAKYPLTVGTEGPAVVLDAGDVGLYDGYAKRGGSYLPVHEGMTMSQYAMLQAMLLPSANNIADTLASWAFGSMGAYRQVAAGYVKSLGMHSTTIGSDASGYDPSTTSTPGDLALLARAAMQNPVVAAIVGQDTAVIPGYGPVSNTNTLLGQAGVVGLKTGTSPAAGGVFMFAANLNIGGEATVVVGAVMGAGESSADAMADAHLLLSSVRAAPAASGAGKASGTP